VLTCCQRFKREHHSSKRNRVDTYSYLLVVDVEVDVEEVPESEHEAELQGLEEPAAFLLRLGGVPGGRGARHLALAGAAARLPVWRGRQQPEPEAPRAHGAASAGDSGGHAERARRREEGPASVGSAPERAHEARP
jgi:hypothetical protein